MNTTLYRNSTSLSSCERVEDGGGHRPVQFDAQIELVALSTSRITSGRPVVHCNVALCTRRHSSPSVPHLRQAGLEALARQREGKLKAWLLHLPPEAPLAGGGLRQVGHHRILKHGCVHVKAARPGPVEQHRAARLLVQGPGGLLAVTAAEQGPLAPAGRAAMS